MNHSEIILIALVLLVVFAGVQIEKFFRFLKGNAPVKEEPKKPVPVKTVLPAEKVAILKQTKTLSNKVQSSKKKVVHKKSTSKKTKQTKKKVVSKTKV